MFHEALLSLLVAALAAQDAARPQHAALFEDPAPPVVHELEPLAPEEPEAFPELAFHAAPKTLPPDARTEDWPCFLGLHHDGTSLETRLSKDLGETGPPLVWEVERGEGFASPVVQGKRLIHVQRVKDATHVDCLDTDRRRCWRFSYPTAYRGRYISDGGRARDAGDLRRRVFVHGVKGLLHCPRPRDGTRRVDARLAAEFRAGRCFFES
jgi:hypothetical protein